MASNVRSGFFRPHRRPRRLGTAFFSLLILFVPVTAGGTEALAEPSLRAVIRTGDGGHQRDRHRRALEKALAAGGCPAEVAWIEGDAPTPAAADLEFSWKPRDRGEEPPTGFRPLARAVTIEGGDRVGGALLVPGSSGIDDPAILAGERIAFVSPLSPGGYLLPVAILTAAGAAPEADQAVFVGNHGGAVSLLLHGDVSAAAVAAPLARKWSRSGELAILAQTATVPTGGWRIHQRAAARWGEPCRKALAGLKENRLKAFPAWIGGFVPE